MRIVVAVQGYDSTTYGDGFADVYDEWYGEVTDVEATTALVVDLASPGGRVLELGVGTGRLALPIAAAGLTVVGIDSSRAMLDRLAQRLAERGGTIEVDVVEGDMVDDVPPGPFAVALAAYNTLFNLLTHDRQRACFAAVADRLVPGGRFVVEAMVPDETAPAGSDVSVRSLSADRVVLSVSDHRPADQRTVGQFVDITEAAGVRLRPWAIRWATVAELDAMADDTGFELEHRAADMAGARFDDDSSQHVTVYRKRS